VIAQEILDRRWYNEVVITGTAADGVHTSDSLPLIWYNGAWIWGFTGKIKVDPVGLPAAGATQS